MKVEIGKFYYWRDSRKCDNWGTAEGFDKHGNVIIRDTQGEVWIVPEDQLMEW